MDTIYSLATAPINQNIAIIRISGSDSFSSVLKISNLKKEELQPNKALNKKIIIDGEFIDSALILVFKSPFSFTGEDIIEIQCHGSLIVVSKILKKLEKIGLRQAKRGEFSRRSFINNKIDLVQAESINGLIFSQSSRVQEIHSSQLNGESSKEIEDLKQDILNSIAKLEVSIDYPEFDDSRKVTNKSVKKELTAILKKMKKIYDSSKVISNSNSGIRIAIVGKPNVGKSSILNKLIKEEKAIVFNEPGTTRDIVEGEFYLNGVLYKLIDTAGIRKTDSKIESIGVKKSLNFITEADIVLGVFDNSKKLDSEDIKIIEKIKNKKTIYILNKNDLQSNFDDKGLPKKPLKVSAAKGTVHKIFVEIEKISKRIFFSNDSQILSGERQLSLMNKSIDVLEKVIDAIDSNLVLDLISDDLKEIYNLYDEILGKDIKINLLDEIFSKFCLGK